MSHWALTKKYGLTLKPHGTFYTEYGVFSGGWWSLEDIGPRVLYLDTLDGASARCRKLCRIYQSLIDVHEFTPKELETVAWLKMSGQCSE